VGAYIPVESQLAMANRLRVRVGAQSDTFGEHIARSLLSKGAGDHDFFLDLLDAALDAFLEDQSSAVALEQILSDAGSTWQVRQDGRGLERRVGYELAEAFALAAAPSDLVSKDLREAWANAYGRNGDPSDAWDHAIKALEHLLIPIVVPNKTKATLSDVVGTLRRNDGNKWRCSLPGKDECHEVSPLVGTLDLIWPNTVDRHGGGAANRPPTEAEARTVVSLTVALVQAHREEPIVYRV